MLKWYYSWVVKIIGHLFWINANINNYSSSDFYWDVRWVEGWLNKGFDTIRSQLDERQGQNLKKNHCKKNVSI